MRPRWFLLLPIIISGCAPTLSREQARHVVWVDGVGVACDPCRGLVREDPRVAAAHVVAVVADLRDAVLAHARHDGHGLRAVVFIHGGLNSTGIIERRTRDLHAAMRADGVHPIFINYESGMAGCYGANLRRFGDGAVGLAASPVALAADVVRGAVRIPASALASTQVLVGRYDRPAGTLAAFDRLSAAPAGGPGGTIVIGPVRESAWARTGRFAGEALVPAHYFTAPFIDAVGMPSWDQMRRRARALMQPPPGRPAAIAELFAALAADRDISVASRDGRLELVLIVHSMGTLLANEVLVAQPTLRFSEIVYLAAACPIDDVRTLVVPYLALHGREGSQRAPRFVSVMLHPLAEANEIMATAFCPRGSLLVWVDRLFGERQDGLDRTFGRCDNALESLHVFPAALRPSVTMHVYGYRTGEPQRHSQFSRSQTGFWRRDAFTGAVPAGYRSARF
ncbi:MAG TPA: hypothetical protein VEL07_04875 [Planctomycetota bacterium]|nr:hypothetical protein [Planctomycetota bacterium]